MAIKRQSSAFFSPTRFNIPIPELDDSPHCTPKKSPMRMTILESPRKKCILPTLPLNGSIPRISGDTLTSVLNGDYDTYFDELFVVDCRFDYEYDGGHIKNAINCNSPEMLYDLFFKKQYYKDSIIVFHCEFSQNRGPQMAGIFREKDRELNKMDYPELYYPNVFVLDGGYRKFFEEHSDLCDGGYIKMLDDVHRTNGDLCRATTNFRKNVDKAESHNRSTQTSVSKYGSYDTSKSPVSFGDINKSPMTAKMLNFFSSPVVPRHLRNDPEQ